MAKTTFPAVYVEEISKFPPSIASVETAIPVFIGYTQKAQQHAPRDLLFTPTRVNSRLEYEKYFGVPYAETGIQISLDTTEAPNVKAKSTISGPSNYLMHYSLQLFYLNGGGPCYIVSVGTYSSRNALSLQILQKGLRAAGKISDATLVILPDSTKLSSKSDYYSLHKEALAQAANLKDRFVIMDVWDQSNDAAFNPVEALRNADLGDTSIRKYGAAYYPRLRTTIAYHYKEEKVTVVCANNQRLNGTLKALKEKDSACYAAAKKAMEEVRAVLPVSGAVAGIYAFVDATRGVWKAPANVSVNGVFGPEVMIRDQQQDNLNIDVVHGKSINAIRQFIGKGTLIWGARTLAGNDNEWRYISVRRFFTMVEVSVTKAIQPFVFEPNDANTWTKIQGMVENYLTQQWRIGALQGAKPEHAFYITVGLGSTMTAADVLEGRLIVEIGMAVIRPAEFIILRIVLKMDSQS